MNSCKPALRASLSVAADEHGCPAGMCSSVQAQLAEKGVLSAVLLQCMISMVHKRGLWAKQMALCEQVQCSHHSSHQLCDGGPAGGFAGHKAHGTGI